MPHQTNISLYCEKHSIAQIIFSWLYIGWKHTMDPFRTLLSLIL
jgi:hypothetical protein